MKTGMFLLGTLIVTCAVTFVSGREPNSVPAKSPGLRMCGDCRERASASALGGHGTDSRPGCNLPRDWSLGSRSLAPFLGGSSRPAG